MNLCISSLCIVETFSILEEVVGCWMKGGRPAAGEMTVVKINIIFTIFGELLLSCSWSWLLYIYYI